MRQPQGNVLAATSLFLGLVLTAAPAAADTLRIDCTGGTVCTGGSVTQISNGGNLSFNLSNTDNASLAGTAFVTVLNPNGTAQPPTFTFSGTLVNSPNGTFYDTNSQPAPNKLGTLLGGSSAPANYTFSSLVSASGQVGVTANNFQAYLFNVGPYLSGPNGGTGLSGLSFGGLALGTVLVAWVTNGVFNQTPLSGSVTVPEPASLLLLGSGLTAMGLWQLWQWRRRRDVQA